MVQQFIVCIKRQSNVLHCVSFFTIQCVNSCFILLFCVVQHEIASCNVASCHDMPCCIMLNRVKLCHIRLCCAVSCFVVTCHVAQHCMASCCVVLRHVVSQHNMACHDKHFFCSLRCIVLRHAMLWHTALFCFVLYRVVMHHATLSNFASCHAISLSSKFHYVCHAMLHCVASPHITSLCVVVCCVALRHNTLRNIIFYWTILHCVASHRATLHCVVMFHCIDLRCAALRCIVLCCIVA